MLRGLIPADRLGSVSAPQRVRVWVEPGRHLVHYAVAGGRLISFAASAPVSMGVESWSAQGNLAALMDTYADWHPAVRAVIGGATEVGLFPLYERAALARWSADRVTLVGDAAHPMLPFLAQGANQAIEDAVALARCLAGAGRAAVAAALLVYERLRMPRAAAVQSRSRGIGIMIHRSELGRADAVAPSGGLATSGTDLDWLYGYDAEAEAAKATRAWATPD
jgi:salicylate hydroxylase